MRLLSAQASHLSRTSPQVRGAMLETMELIWEYLIYRHSSLFKYRFHHRQKQVRIDTKDTYPLSIDHILKYAQLLIEDDSTLMIEVDDGQYYLKADIILHHEF